MIVTAIEVFCDICSWWERLETPSIRKHWPELQKAGWTKKKGKHYCPNCKVKIPK